MSSAKPRVQTRMPEHQKERIDELREEEFGGVSQSEAVRRLLVTGIKEESSKRQHQDRLRDAAWAVLALSFASYVLYPGDLAGWTALLSATLFVAAIAHEAYHRWSGWD